jgi:hypothetical protein
MRPFIAALAASLLITASAQAAVPTATTGNANSITQTSAKLNGTVKPNNEATTWHFEFGTTTAYGTKTAVRSAGSGANPTGVSSTLAGLAASTTYHYRLVASNNTGTTLGADRTFTTAGPPTVVTGGLQSDSPTAVTVTGSVNPGGRSTSWHVEYGTTTAYGSRTASANVGSGTAAVAVSQLISNLTPSTTYHYRLVASNNHGTRQGTDATFTTPAAVTIKQSGFRVVAGHYVTLSGTVAGAQAGVQVTISAQPFGSTAFGQVATVTTGGGGVWTYLAQPKIETTYQATANGGSSTTVKIGVQPSMTFKLITKSRFSTKVMGATGFPGKLVKFQRLANGRWVTVKQTRLNAASVAIFPGLLLPKGRNVIRVAMSVNQAGPGYLGGLSRQLVFKRT